MISEIKDIFDLINIFPNLTTVSNEAKSTIIFLSCIFLFVSFDKGKTYKIFVLFQKNQLKLLSMFVKIRFCCSYLLSIFGWINISLWILLLITHQLSITFGSNNTIKHWNNLVIFIENDICIILNLTFFVCYTYVIIYIIFANQFFKANTFLKRVTCKFKYFYLNLDLNIFKVLLLIESIVFFIVTIDLNFIKPFINQKSLSNSGFSTLTIIIISILLFAKLVEQNKKSYFFLSKMKTFFNEKKGNKY